MVSRGFPSDVASTPYAGATPNHTRIATTGDVQVQARGGAAQRGHAPWGQIGIAAGTVAALLTTDAIMHAPTRPDVWTINRVQELDLPGLHSAVTVISTLTGSTMAIALWAVALVAFVVTKRWLPALGVFMLPLGGVLNQIVGEVLVPRTRPELDQVMRTIGETDAASFPSGHVMGAVMFYGFLLFLAARLPQAWLRIPAFIGGGLVIAAVGFARIWEGAHWPTDVLAAYAFGGLFLAVLFSVYLRVEAAVGHLPFVRAGEVAHDETQEHAHALTSVVLFDREAGEVSKVYNPGFLPRAVYFASFQAPFPYASNRDALDAAVARRNLAGLLTEYWYGTSRVAKALRVEDDGTGTQMALVSELVDGRAPENRAAARSFLNDLKARFEEAGLPTWQIDARQPRAIDNVLETANGYTIVDLESGLVAPLASRRTWLRGLRRKQVPLFDTVFFDITRAYIARETPQMLDLRGGDWLDELHIALEAAEAATARWHAAEPRLWSVALQPRSWAGRLQRQTTNGQTKALDALESATERWQQDGRISVAEANQLRAELESPQFQAVLPHLGAHVGISVVLRFPFGSIARAGWTTAALVGATGRLLTRRMSLLEFRQAFSLHNPLVIALAAIPGFGAFAYLASGPVRGNRLLIRITLDALLQHLPANLYRRSGMERVITTGRPAGRYTGRDGRKREHNGNDRDRGQGRGQGQGGGGERRPRLLRPHSPAAVPVAVPVAASVHRHRDAA